MSDGISDACEPMQDEGLYAHHIHWFLIPAVVILVVLSLLEKRKSYRLDVFGGRPGAVRPMGFLNETSNRWGQMFVLGSVTGSVITMATKAFGADFGIWAKILLIYVFCLETCVICYPLFACMTVRHKLAGSILGLCYSCGWLAFQLYIDIQSMVCLRAYGSTAAIGLEVFGFVADAPIIVCDILVVVKFSHKLYKCIRSGIYTVKPEELCQLCRSHHKTYVKCLLKPTLREAPSSEERPSLKHVVVSRFVKNVPGFRFPVTIVGTAFMCLIMLYLIILAEVAVLHMYQLGQHTDLWIAAIVIATLATLSVGLRNIFQLVINYRRDLLYLYKGKRDFIPLNVQSPSPNVYMSRGMRYIGTTIAGMIWGTIICFMVVFIPTFLMFFTFRELIDQGKLPDLLKQLQWLVYPVCMIIIFQLQTFLIGRFLLQDKLNKTDEYRPLAVDNRNVYDILSFFMIFLNVSIGVFTFLKRILVGSVVGIFLIPRMDRSLFIRGFETMDKCYMNYVGMLMVDFSHSNPIMHVFCGLVKEAMEETRVHQNAVENPTYGSNVHIRKESRKPIARRRWWLAYTLINNPQLAAARKSQLPGIQISIQGDTNDVRYAQLDHTGGCSVNCCSRYRLAIPANFSTNVATLSILLSIAFIAVGLSVML